MHYSLKIALLFIILSSCTIPETPKPRSLIKPCHYDSLTIPLFFKTLTQNHIAHFINIKNWGSMQYYAGFNVNPNNVANIEKFYTIKILHDLFTSQSATNCSKGKILNIPYFWHWVTPNPRNSICFTNTKTLLKNTNPPPEFRNYNSFAEIDRTPYLFLSDLVNPELRYYTSSCDTFPTFGWCSEREMAFVALLKTMNYNGYVVVSGAHSWSEFIISLTLYNGDTQNYKITVDNTFNTFKCAAIVPDAIAEWKTTIENSTQSAWYNQQAGSANELSRITNHVVSEKAMARIENRVVAYLNQELNKY